MQTESRCVKLPLVVNISVCKNICFQVKNLIKSYWFHSEVTTSVEIQFGFLPAYHFKSTFSAVYFWGITQKVAVSSNPTKNPSGFLLPKDSRAQLVSLSGKYIGAAVSRSWIAHFLQRTTVLSSTISFWFICVNASYTFLLFGILFSIKWAVAKVVSVIFH